MKVLVVDDSESSRTLIKDILTAHKHEVETADNGVDALIKYEKFKPDLITLDLAMPVMDGYETLKRIFRMDRNANVIMITASEQNDYLQKCLQSGAIGYVVKPFTKKEIIQNITNALRAGNDKNIVALFSLATDKIAHAIEKILNVDASIILSDIQVIRQEFSTQSFLSQGSSFQIRSVPKIVEKLQIKVPDGAISYITKIGGQQNGMIISSIQKEDMKTLFNIDSNVQYNVMNKPLEFFHTIHCKLLSYLANATNLILNLEPTQLYLDKDAIDIPQNKQLTRATLEIGIRQKRIPVEIQLLFQIGQIFNRF